MLGLLLHQTRAQNVDPRCALRPLTLGGISPLALNKPRKVIHRRRLPCQNRAAVLCRPGPSATSSRSSSLHLARNLEPPAPTGRAARLGEPSSRAAGGLVQL